MKMEEYSPNTTFFLTWLMFTMKSLLESNPSDSLESRCERTLSPGGPGLLSGIPGITLVCPIPVSYTGRSTANL